MHIATPLADAPALARPGQRLRLKLELLQPSGSFKMRGVGHACQVHAARGARRLLSSSGGNAGLAVAHAGARLGLPVRVVVPQTTGERARALIRAQGAELLVHGASWQEAHEHLLGQLAEGDAFIHPFDDPLLWQGHASLVTEAAQQGPRPDVVVLSVGGGGLLCGVLQGLHAVGWHDVPVVAVETEGAHSLHAAVAAGAPVTLPAITSVATSLGARRVCDAALDWTRRHPVHAVTVSDAQAVQACLALADAQRLIVEPACGAALAAVRAPSLPQLRDAADVLLVLCGGVTTPYPELQALAARLGA
ncbi:MAG: serine dehydratase [Burkholderiales bacterium PBB5]|nr:MAG: serine dehydratase [Burkholderiales bacterium PBB5]